VSFCISLSENSYFYTIVLQIDLNNDINIYKLFSMYCLKEIDI